MRTQLLSSFTLIAVAIGLAACSDDAPSPTTVAPPTSVNSALVGIACDFSQTKQDGRAYIASPTDAFFDYVTNMQKASQAADWAGVHRYGMLAEGRLADIRGTKQQKAGSTAIDGGKVATDIAVCFNSSTIGDIPSDFPDKVKLAMDKGGVFEVPGVSIGASQGAYSRGETPFWGLEPKQTWPTTTLGGLILIYGFKDPTFTTGDPQVVSAFDHRSLPDKTTGLIDFGNRLFDFAACDIGSVPLTVRLQHISTILPSTPASCAGGDPWDPPASLSSLIGLDILSFFAPKPAYAAMVFGLAAGTGSTWSPSVVIDMQSVVASFYSQPTNAVVGKPIPGTPPSQYVQVKVTTLKGTPLIGATVTITVAGNSGTNVKPFNNVEVTVGPDGIATFDELYVNKTGGYTLFATPSFDGVSGATVTSNLFNVQSK